MKDIYEKVSKIIGDLMVYCDIDSISDLLFFKDKVTFVVHIANTCKNIAIDYVELVNLHDYKLERYIVGLFGNE